MSPKAKKNPNRRSPNANAVQSAHPQNAAWYAPKKIQITTPASANNPPEYGLSPAGTHFPDDYGWPQNSPEECPEQSVSLALGEAISEEAPEEHPQRPNEYRSAWHRHLQGEQSASFLSPFRVATVATES